MARGQSSRAGAAAETERSQIEAAQRDPQVFGEIYEQNFERVYAFVARRVRSREEAQDVTSEVFHRALANIGRFEWRGVPFAAWLFKIAGNAIADRSQRAAKDQQLRQRATRETDTALEAQQSELEAIEERARLFRMVDLLPADQRRVIVMRFAEEKSIREISRELGRTEGAVKQLQSRGLQNLRERLGITDV